jgi:nitrite reductase/ring-hydroxylating ferredoxin subunit
MPDPLPWEVPLAPPQRLCAAADLEERGRAMLFEVLEYGQRMRAFALRIDGTVVAYLNRCLHVPMELDWVPGEFLDSEREFIMCSTHGAVYEPATGRCAGGPCGRGRLTPVTVAEVDGEVYWYPSRDIRPAPALEPAPPPPEAAPPSAPAPEGFEP